MRLFPFVQLDVFSARPLEGNPLAVFTDGRALSDAEMQALAREMNLSETTFILPRSAAVERSRGVRVRIFTTEEELPFAGHPTLGTAMVLRNLGRARSAQPRAPGRSKVLFPHAGPAPQGLRLVERKSYSTSKSAESQSPFAKKRARSSAKCASATPSSAPSTTPGSWPAWPD